MMPIRRRSGRQRNRYRSCTSLRSLLLQYFLVLWTLCIVGTADADGLRNRDRDRDLRTQAQNAKEALSSHDHMLVPQSFIHEAAMAAQNATPMIITNISSKAGTSSFIDRSQNANLTSPGTVQVMGFVENRVIEECRNNILLADANDDLILTRSEYAELVALESDKQIVHPFSQLDLVFVVIFYTVACDVCYRSTGNNQCCVGDKAVIPLTPESNPDLDWSLNYLCINTHLAVDQITGQMSPAPTTSPSPATEPTVTQHPTLTATPSVSVAPSIPVNREPTFLPSPVVLASSSPSSLVPTASPLSLVPLASLTPSLFTTASARPTPTSNPTMLVSDAPSSSPTSTTEPTVVLTTSTPTITSNPTMLASDSPSNLPSMTIAPSMIQTTATTLSSAPTVIASAESNTPSYARSDSPSAMPTETSIPTTTLQPTTETMVPSISLAPTISDMPSDLPSDMLSDTPSTGPSGLINPADLLCINIRYTINNRAGFTADEIMNEVNNTIKDRLEIAGRTTTIDILNATYPRTDNNTNETVIGGLMPYFTKVRSGQMNISGTGMGRRQRRLRLADEVLASDALNQALVDHLGVTDTDFSVVQSILRPSSVNYVSSQPRQPNHELSVSRLQHTQEQSQPAIRSWRDILGFQSTQHSQQQHKRPVQVHGDEQGRRWQPQQRITANHHRHQRRLVFYTDLYPVEITSVIDNPTCPEADGDPMIECAIVTMRICTVLEQGDDASAVRRTLTNGFRDAINSGDFAKNIPTDR